MSYFPKMNFWGTNNRSLVCLFCLFLLGFMVDCVYFTVPVFLFSCLNITAAILLFYFLLTENLYFLLNWHFRLHSNTKYDNLWNFCVTIKRTAHIVGNNKHLGIVVINLEQVSLDKLAVFFVFDAIICSLIYSFKFLVYIQ